MLPYSEQGRFAKNIPKSHEDDELNEFFETAYHDMRFFLRTITKNKANSYTFFGDVQKHMFYISDNLRNEFGFDSNIVYNFADEWEKRIYRANAVEKFRYNIQNLMDRKQYVYDTRYQVKTKDGQIIWIRCCGEIQWDEEKNKPLFAAGRMTKQDDHFVIDPITNFPSGSALLNHISEIQERNLSAYAVGFCYNNVFQINTTIGRSLVDRLIYKISEQLMDELFDKVTFYRLPGVRCLTIVEDKHSLDPEELIEKIRTIIEKNYVKNGFIIPNPCSFAYMELPQRNVNPTELREKMVSLIKMARHSPHLPYVKDSKENTEKIYKYSKLEMQINQDVINGMQNFRAVIQPVVDVKTGEICAGETLMRWKFEGKDISPAVFIPILEKNNMICEAGRWIFEEAVQFCKRVVSTKEDFYLTVNVSLEQLYDEGFLDFIAHILEKYQLDGLHIVMEMTESCMDSEPEKLKQMMTVCQGMGIRFALDDFGTGYSSLRVLLHYPSDIIKLDRSLLLEMTESKDKMNFISSIVFACHRFDKSVCMEGVENDAQNQIVKESCCDTIQGFYYYKPIEMENLLEIIQEK